MWKIKEKLKYTCQYNDNGHLKTEVEPRLEMPCIKYTPDDGKCPT